VSILCLEVAVGYYVVCLEVVEAAVSSASPLLFSFFFPFIGR
jgi:hypothetical protein